MRLGGTYVLVESVMNIDQKFPLSNVSKTIFFYSF